MMDTIYISDKSIIELENLFLCEINDDDFYDVIAFNIEQKKPGYWIENISRLDDNRQRAAAFSMGLSKAPKKLLSETLMQLIEHENEFVASTAIDSLRRLKSRKAKKHVLNLIKHSSPYVTGASLRFLAFAMKEKAIPIISPYLNHESPIVRQNAIDELSEIGGPKEISLIRPLTKDIAADVRLAARHAISQLQDSNNL
ncbi:HEAT repeat protein [Pseudomonas alcaligenes]|nr:HEAT repeat protein [Pseudomonas alcaligenes]